MPANFFHRNPLYETMVGVNLNSNSIGNSPSSLNVDSFLPGNYSPIGNIQDNGEVDEKL